MDTERPLEMRAALLPLVGTAGYQRLLTVMYSSEVLRHMQVAPETLHRVADTIASHGVEAIPRHEILLESDSKSRIYVVRTQFDGSDPWTLVLKWYSGTRQRQAPIEAQMSAYFRQCLASYCAVVPILAVVPISTAADAPLSVALLPYLGDVTLYDRLHHLPRQAPQVEALLRQASATLGYTQVLGRMGHEEHTIQLNDLSPEEAVSYFLGQIDSALLRPLAASGQPLNIVASLREQFTFFATVLAADSCTAGLYYRGVNPRNIMLVGSEQVEIDFEQDSLRSRFIDIVSLLENGLEMAHWDTTADYPAFEGQMAFDAWNLRRQHAWTVLAQYNYLSHKQVEALTHDFLDATWRLEQQYLQPARSPYSPTERRLLLETVRIFRHLQYIGYCKRNEQQALTESKRLSSRYRQHFHALWAKSALDNLLFPSCPEAQCLPATGRPAATALRRTLDMLLLGPVVSA